MNKIWKTYLLLVLLVFQLHPVCAQETKTLSLNEALEIAETNNRLIKIFRYQQMASEAGLSEMKSNFFPRLKAEGTFAYNSDPDIYVYKGEFNHIYHELVNIDWIDQLLEEYLPLPPKDMTLIHGDDFIYKTSISLYQPITQLSEINSGKKVAETDVNIRRLETENMISEIKLGVVELFYGIMLEEKRVKATTARLEYKESEYQDAINAVEADELLRVDAMGLKAELSETEHELISIRNNLEVYRLKLKQLLGIDFIVEPRMDEQIRLEEMNPLQQSIEWASDSSYSAQKAELFVHKARFGIDAARKEYIPGLTLFGQYNYNHGIPLTPRSYFLTGLNLEWNIFSSGERAARIRQRNAELEEATEDLLYQQESMRHEAEKLFLEIRNAKKLMLTANEALKARKEEYRLMRDALEAGEKLNTDLLKAKAELEESIADVFASRVNYKILLARMKHLLGILDQ